MPKYEGTSDKYYNLWPEDLVIIGLDTDDGPEHPLWDRRIHLELIPEFVRSVAAVGVFTPVDCIKDGDKIVCVFGRQRIKAARKINADLIKQGKKKTCHVPTIIHAKAMESNLVSKQIAENELRQQDDLRCRIEKLQRLFDHGGDATDACMVFGKKRQTIDRWVAFMGLAHPLQERVFSGDMSVSQALKYAKKPRKDQVWAAKHVKKAKRGRPGGPSRKTLERFVEEAATGTVDKSFLEGVRFAIGKVSAEEAGVQEELKKAKRGGK
jgi:hypothetical protein